MDSKGEYLYVILDYNGVTWLVRDNATERGPGLPSLLSEGWRPVRETPYHIGQGMPYMLILLERNGKGGGDFGFA